MYTKLYTSEYGNFIFQNVIYFFFDRRIIGQMRRNLEQAVSSLPNQWPPLTPCLSLQGSARSPTRPVPAHPVTAYLMMMLTMHCLPLQPNLGPIGKWYFCSFLLKMEGQGHIYFGLYSCQHLELWKFKTSYLVFQNLCQYRVKVISKCQVQTYFIENLLQYVFFFFFNLPAQHTLLFYFSSKSKTKPTKSLFEDEEEEDLFSSKPASKPAAKVSQVDRLK